ncbi:MAG: T9SS type A sorting domain-containing protein [Ignavibacteria bacterium]|nr:T9SS type A sorting domain-containing protein [Ignavibacteria bacterium]
MTAFNYMPPYNLLNECLNDPSGSPLKAFNILRGFRTDNSGWLNPTTVPPYKTKYCFSGNPEDSSGWTEYKGIICLYGNLIPSLPGNKRSMMVTGSDSLTVQPNRKFNIVFATVIERGGSNLNSVTKIKNLSNIAKIFYDNNFNYSDDDISFIQSIPEVSPVYSLSQNYPNPFNPATKIKFFIPENTFTSLKIYDVNGKEIAVLENKILAIGEYEYKWNAANLPSGIYFYKLETESFTQTKKMILIK